MKAKELSKEDINTINKTIKLLHKLTEAQEIALTCSGDEEVVDSLEDIKQCEIICLYQMITR